MPNGPLGSPYLRGRLPIAESLKFMEMQSAQSLILVK